MIPLSDSGKDQKVRLNCSGVDSPSSNHTMRSDHPLDSCLQKLAHLDDIFSRLITRYLDIPVEIAFSERQLSPS
ncbi:hypothetical protein G5S52_09465 [Grimontia sp. S25]|uniref:Uncharacterized protein n=1 Tax=Grimontia sedimenti TaxID=2711294 RepID=A0A6M1R677_9GAMM|nr:hypothetical protein [Grimontia sedimenti]NGN97875.1 hypothetical protein [Grimontia sedimenti]